MRATILPPPAPLNCGSIASQETPSFTGIAEQVLRASQNRAPRVQARLSLAHRCILPPWCENPVVPAQHPRGALTLAFLYPGCHWPANDSAPFLSCVICDDLGGPPGPGIVTNHLADLALEGLVERAVSSTYLGAAPRCLLPASRAAYAASACQAGGSCFFPSSSNSQPLTTFLSFWLAISEPNDGSPGGGKPHLESGLNKRDRATGAFSGAHTHRKPGKKIHFRCFDTNTQGDTNTQYNRQTTALRSHRPLAGGCRRGMQLQCSVVLWNCSSLTLAVALQAPGRGGL